MYDIGCIGGLLKKTNNTRNDNNSQSKYSNAPGSDLVGTDQNLNQICNFLDKTSGFQYTVTTTKISLTQKEDRKTMEIVVDEVDKVITRTDYDGSEFIQINFKNNNKALLTTNLIGFKPFQLAGFDTSKIPKVVTTMDLKSVLIAIEDSLEEDLTQNITEFDVLRKVYQSIMLGAESVGIRMSEEKNWYIRNLLNSRAAAA